MKSNFKTTTFLVCVGSLLAVAARIAVSADITGTVSLQGQASNADAVVYIDGPVKVPGGYEIPKAKLVNRDKTFVPGVLPVVAHSHVVITNEDDLYHNTYSVSPKNSFNVALHRKGDIGDVVLDNPGPVDVFCVIH